MIASDVDRQRVWSSLEFAWGRQRVWSSLQFAWGRQRVRSSVEVAREVAPS